MAPIVTFVSFSLLLGIVGGLKLPIKDVTPWLWIIFIILTLFGLKLIISSFLSKNIFLSQTRPKALTILDDSVIDRAKGLNTNKGNQQIRIVSYKSYYIRSKLLQIWVFYKNSTRIKPLIILFLVFLFPIMVMVRYFWNDLTSYLGSQAPDGWSYVSIGQYMWEYPRGVEVKLAPLYQYGFIFKTSR